MGFYFWMYDMKDSLCYIYFSCTVYWNINCWRHMSATPSDGRKYTCIYGCVHNDAWGSPWRGWPTSMQLHGCMRHHFVFYFYMDIFTEIYCIYIYIYKKTHSATHVHIYTYPTSATLPCWASCLRHPLHSCRMAACVCSAQPSKQPVATTDVFFFAW